MTVKEYNKSVDNYSDNVFRFILKNTRDQLKAQDIIQDTYEKLWIHHQQVNFDKVRSYIFSTAYHTMIDYIRKDKKMTDVKDIEQENYSHDPQYSDLSEILDIAVNKLPCDQKNAILLRDYEGYSYKEIGEITGMSESQVKVYIYRARLFLKKYIGSPETVI
jgi:RNA polymerase sigma factor (sigma-70 family)